MPKNAPVSNYEIYKKPHWTKKNGFIILTITVGLILMNLIFISDSYNGDTIEPAKAGQLGDFIGGYIGTFFALVSIVLLFVTLRDQRNSTTRDKFETKYFELIQLHRENVAEIKVGEDTGRKAFVHLVREFREILKVVELEVKNHQLHYSQEQLFIISYLALFNGVGPNSSRMFKDALSGFDKSLVDRLEATLNSASLKDSVKKLRNFPYIPFEGHISRLGHYYRHLYQAVCFVDNQTLDIDKYSFVKTIRAQLSTHEQVLLFINSLSPQGRVWFDEGLLRRYRLVKNIPPTFFDEQTEINITTYFPADYFEWQEE